MGKLEFGNIWTVEELNAIDAYLDFYTTALKNKGFKLCYIDAFAGSGSIRIKSGAELDGSAIRALKYPFDEFLFFEEKQYIEDLKQKVNEMPVKRNVKYYREDCNSYLLQIDKRFWKRENWRGVIFLDPHAMELAWDCLNKISNTEAFDVWYLFPFMAANRNFYKIGLTKAIINFLMDLTRLPKRD